MMIDLVVDKGLGDCRLPDTGQLEEAAQAACRAAGLNRGTPQICLRICSNMDMKALNKQWRDQNNPTDVLSFSMQDGPDYDLSEPLGDIVMAWPYVKREAVRLGLKPQYHVLHLVVHAVLHLLGYDHGTDQEARRMQTCERRTLRALGLHDPYVRGNETVS